MAEITPEERVQKVKADLLEDLDFEPEHVRNFFTSNIVTRALAHLVGWTGRGAKMLRCTQAGELKTAPTTTGIEELERAYANAPDDWIVAIEFSQVISRLDVFVWDNPMYLRIYSVKNSYFGAIEIPPGFYSVDIRTAEVWVKNLVAGNIARYQIIGWH